MIDMLKAIAEENRLKIIKLLASDSMCVCDIQEKLQLPQNLVSHHIAVLKKAGLIESCRCGKNNFYSLNKQSFNQVHNLLIKLGE